MTYDTFIEIAACPTCRAALALDGPGFRCAQGHLWPTKRGIPRFVGSESYAGNFGFEWRRYKKTQLDRARRTNISEQTFVEKTGLRPEDVRGKRVLDAGCGTGRFSDVIARWGGEPFACDLSLAVETARRNLSVYPGAFVAQADIFKLPFRPASFDVVFSIGVLHHTPSTLDATRAILELLKPGGTLAIWVYPRGNYHKHSDTFRRWTPGMPASLLHLLSNVAIPYYHLLKLAKTVPVAGEYFYYLLSWYLPTSLDDDPMTRALDTYDWYSPYYQWKHTPEELEGWFRDFGLEAIERQPLWPTACRGRLPFPRPV